MRSLWLNICVLIVIQQTMSVAHARFPHEPLGDHGPHGPHGPMFKKCCNSEETPDEIKHLETTKKLMEECEQELGNKYLISLSSQHLD